MKEFLLELENADKIGVISHINPDADNLGSLTALSRSLRLHGKRVETICLDPIPYNLEFLPGIEKATPNYSESFDMLFVLDCSSEDRLGTARFLLESSKTIVNIDHHISNNIKGKYNIVKNTYSSTGEVLYEFLSEIGLPIDKEVGTSILTAIVGDSGSFRYDTVSSRTFQFASELLDIGVNLYEISYNLFSKNRISKVRLMSRALERLTLDMDKKLAYSYVFDSDFEEFEAADADVEGIVEYMRDIDGIEIAILLRQNPVGFKASTRSKKYYNVAELAEKFAGGGHIRSAGFSVREKDVNIVIEKILKEI